MSEHERGFTSMPGPDFTLRDAAEADLPEIVAICNATVPSRVVTADTEPVSVGSRLPRVAGLDGVERDLIVVALRVAP